MRLCMKQDIECYAIQLESKFSSTHVSAIYRAPIGDFEQFLNKLDYIINYLFKPIRGQQRWKIVVYF
jgi:hypothetical protein